MSRAHLFGAPTNQIQFGPASLKLFTIGTPSSGRVTLIEPILAGCIVSLNMKYANVKVNAFENRELVWETSLKPFLKMLRILAVDIVAEIDSWDAFGTFQCAMQRKIYIDMP